MVGSPAIVSCGEGVSGSEQERGEHQQRGERAAHGQEGGRPTDGDEDGRAFGGGADRARPTARTM